MTKSAAHADAVLDADDPLAAARLAAVQTDLERALRGWMLRQLGAAEPTPAQPVAVALSGGSDSVALLATAQGVWPGAVVALHVNHGMQAAAVEFEAVCVALCQSLGVPLEAVSVTVPIEAGASPEAQARSARYKALSQAAKRCAAQAVLLGQHANDQAETVLLALTRGAGVPGLAAMGEGSVKHGVLFGRPFLAVRAATLRQRVQHLGLAFVDDPTNLDQRHARNRIRHSVLPSLSQHFPAIVDTLARTARHAAQAAELLDEIAASDLAALGLECPSITGLQNLSRQRQANVLRHWLQSCAGSAPSTAQLDELLSQVAQCTTRGHSIDIKVSAGHVRRLGLVLKYAPGHGQHR